ncbi:hypothetical protein GKJPGBOP_03309 [Streptomyces paromomycinus]|uniref:Uncharacterized protein n=2 Tax=Streptomyces paromomycinus TaxID=92743 RepID=A0A401W2R8_STREY|nr:hypothetical protein GKJPGBOP_03309 [Streptomyces paromomycinus]
MPPAAGDPESTALLRPIGAQQTQQAQQGPSGGGTQGGQPGPMPGVAPMPPAAGGPAGGRPETPGESTRTLRAIKPNGPRPDTARSAQPAQSAPPGADSEATQFLPPIGAGTPPPGAPFGAQPGAPGSPSAPGTPADRATPAEFEGLFRSGPGAAAPAGASGGVPDATAQLPRFDEPEQQPQGPYGQQPYGGRPQFDQFDQYASPGDHGPDGGGRRRRFAPAAIIGVAVVALAGAGLGVGWALSGGGEDGPAEKKQESGGASGAAKDEGDGKDAKQPSPSADPVAAQAKGLDALLKDSNNSRDAVIGAVKSIKSCDNLDAAAKDLRDAARQRNDLVSRLAKLPVDKLPGSGELTASLNEAWKSSASADNHYAAWAGQVKGKKGCPKGKARGGKEPAKGNADSGRATKAKQQAAKLWNPIAQKYGLTERRPEQL